MNPFRPNLWFFVHHVPSFVLADLNQLASYSKRIRDLSLLAEQLQTYDLEVLEGIERESALRLADRFCHEFQDVHSQAIGGFAGHVRNRP